MILSTKHDVILENQGNGNEDNKMASIDQFGKFKSTISARRNGNRYVGDDDPAHENPDRKN